MTHGGTNSDFPYIYCHEALSLVIKNQSSSRPRNDINASIEGTSRSLLT